MILQLLINGLVSGALYSVMALGFALIYNTTKIFHIAHGAVYAVSSYAFFASLRLLGLPLALSLILGLLSGTLLGIIIEILVYRPLYQKKASSGVILVSSIGIYIFIINLIALIFGNEIKILAPGIQKTYKYGSIILTQIQIIEIIVFIAVLAIFIFMIKATKFGKLIRALSNNPTLLSTLGIEVLKLRIGIFALGSLLAGITSCLSSWDIGMDPYVGMPMLLLSAVAMIAGGIGIFEAPVLGAFLITITQSVAIWKISSKWQDTITFAILIIFLLVRPQGILGKRKRIEEL